MNRRNRMIGSCIVVTGLGLELFLGEGQHKLHTEQRQPEIQAESTKEINYNTASVTHRQLFFDQQLPECYSNIALPKHFFRVMVFLLHDN